MDDEELCAQAPYDKGGFLPNTGLISVYLHPDECIVRPVGQRLECARSGHPTATSDCHR